MGLVLTVWALSSAEPALAADPAEVSVDLPDRLVTGVVSTLVGGTWYQAASVSGEDLAVELTLQMPAVAADPGPVVVIWQIRVAVADIAFGDVLERIVGPPLVEAAQPHCDAAGSCALRIRLAGSVAPALEAADLDWVSSTGLQVSWTVIRTFDDGAQLQVVQPDVGGDSDGGAIAAPSDMYGALISSVVFPASDAALGEIPGTEFNDGSPPPFDWGAAVQDALQGFTPPASLELVPIHVWTPESPTAFLVRLRIDFRDRCPLDRFIVFSDDVTQEVGASVFIGGSTQARADVTLPVGGAWSISLQTAGNDVFNATSLQPLGRGFGLEITGPMSCIDGKGVFTQEGLAQAVPNPSQAASPEATSSEPLEPSPSPQPPDDAEGGEEWLWASLVAMLGLAGLVALGALSLLRRRSGA